MRFDSFLNSFLGIKTPSTSIFSFGFLRFSNFFNLLKIFFFFCRIPICFWVLNCFIAIVFLNGFFNFNQVILDLSFRNLCGLQKRLLLKSLLQPQTLSLSKKLYQNLWLNPRRVSISSFWAATIRLFFLFSISNSELNKTLSLLHFAARRPFSYFKRESQRCCDASFSAKI